MTAMDEKLDRLYNETRTLREEMRTGFSEARAEIAGCRAELRGEISGLRAGVHADVTGLSDGVRDEVAGIRSDLWAFQRQVTWIVGGLAIGLLGLLGAFVGSQY
jgi:hypothetical protein